jgi:hypothetical protein
MRHQWQRTQIAADKTKFNRISKKVTSEIKEYKNKIFHGYLFSLFPSVKNEHSLWNATKRIKRPFIPNRPLLSLDGKSRISDEEEQANSLLVTSKPLSSPTIYSLTFVPM